MSRSGSTVTERSAPTAASSSSMATRSRVGVPVSSVSASSSATAGCSGASPANGTRRRSSTMGMPVRCAASTRRPFGSVRSSTSGSGTSRVGPSGGSGRGPTAVRPISSAVLVRRSLPCVAVSTRQDAAACPAQGRGRGAHLVRRDRREPLRELDGDLGPSVEQLAGAEAEHAVHDAVVLLVEPRRPAGDVPRELLVGRTLRGELVELLVDRGEHPVGVDGRGVHRGDRERVGVAGVERPHQARARGDVGDQAVGVHETPLQAGGLAVAEDGAEQGVAEVAVEVGGRVRQAVADRERRAAGRGRPGRPGGARPAAAARRRTGRVGRRAGRDVAEVLLDQAQRLVDVEVADHGDLRVARRVVGVEERRGVVERGLLQLGEVAVAVVRVGERVVEDRRQQDPREPAVGPVQDVEADLLLDDVDLVAQVLGVQGGRPEPVGLEEQRPLERGGGQHLEVVGVVLVGGAVEDPARALDVPEVAELPQALAALEHEVLEEVREPRAALGLRAEPDVDVHRHPDGGGGGIGDDQDAQTVRQGRAVQFGGRHPSNLALRRGMCASAGTATSRAGAPRTDAATGRRTSPGRAGRGCGRR